MGKRMVLACILFTVIVFGIVYFYHETQKESLSGKGVLITANDMGWRRLWQE